MSTLPTPIVLLTKQGVNMGDHAQDVTRAIEVRPGETVTELAHRVLTTRQWSTTPERVPTPEPEWHLTIRLPVEGSDG